MLICFDLLPPPVSLSSPDISSSRWCISFSCSHNSSVSIPSSSSLHVLFLPLLTWSPLVSLTSSFSLIASLNHLLFKKLGAALKLLTPIQFSDMPRCNVSFLLLCWAAFLSIYPFLPSFLPIPLVVCSALWVSSFSQDVTKLALPPSQALWREERADMRHITAGRFIRRRALNVCKNINRKADAHLNFN